ncbi:hypothetical protein [Corynebacterium sp.]|uniref:hypothetical protein n=1 Tax=Corynebacterium sp. TaxID=1720 RepID=UPI0026DDB506|nr:hypothetical protein [Corynebacterium sp.]MDO5031409.1 hypothetical protein [Corynebacterium sp.]
MSSAAGAARMSPAAQPGGPRGTRAPKAATYYRRRRLAALVLLLVLALLVVLVFGIFGTQRSTAVQGDQLGPDSDEPRAQYLERAADTVAQAEDPAYALVSFARPMSPAGVAAALEPAPRMDAIIIGMAAPIAVAEPSLGRDRVDVITAELERVHAAYEAAPDTVDAAVVWAGGDKLREIAANPAVAAVEAAPADAAWGSFGVRPLSAEQ